MCLVTSYHSYGRKVARCERSLLQEISKFALVENWLHAATKVNSYASQLPSLRYFPVDIITDLVARRQNLNTLHHRLRSVQNLLSPKDWLRAAIAGKQLHTSPHS